jgi:hypothetical protein
MMVMAAIRFISALQDSPAITKRNFRGEFFTRKLAPTIHQIKDFGRLFFLLTPPHFSGIFLLEILGDRSTVGQRTLTP